MKVQRKNDKYIKFNIPKLVERQVHYFLTIKIKLNIQGLHELEHVSQLFWLSMRNILRSIKQRNINNKNDYKLC